MFMIGLPKMETKDMPHGIVGSRFAQALINGEFEKAHEMLCPALKEEYPVAALRQNYDSMVAYAQPVGKPNVFVVDNSAKEGDAEGWAYVAIEGEGWSEAVIVTAKPDGPGYLISELVWGRP
jgi:hypothetical protein